MADEFHIERKAKNRKQIFLLVGVENRITPCVLYSTYSTLSEHQQKFNFFDGRFSLLSINWVATLVNAALVTETFLDVALVTK